MHLTHANREHSGQRRGSTRSVPTPAVRHRVQKSMSLKRNDAQQASQASRISAQLNTVQQEQQQALTRELIELNKSLRKSDCEGREGELHQLKSSLSLPLPTELVVVDRPYPKRVLFIVANEFCERFSYYGLRTVLVLYFRSVLGFSDAASTVSFHLFASLCYLTPILGAILGDSIWGKFKTILYLSIIYFLGELVLVLSAIFWDSGLLSVGATFLGLFMIGLGTGGIKPCVSALGGDQFLAHEDRWRQTFFSLFYGAINLGSLISMFVTPLLRSDFRCVNRSDCYPYAFGLPCLLMFVAILVFLAAKNQYTLVPLPESNVIVAFCQCVWLALKRKLTGATLPESQLTASVALSDCTSSSSLSVSSNEDVSTKYTRTLEAQAKAPTRPSGHISGSKKGESKKQISNHWLLLASDRFDQRSIEDFRSVLGILLLFVPIPVYWCLFDQQSSLWTLQATRMDGKVFGSKFVIQPDQMSVANPLLLLMSIPLFEFFIYPTLNRCNLLTKPIQRMSVGGLLAALTFVLSAMIEVQIQKFTPANEPLAGSANLLIVNGLSECSIVEPMISYVQIPGNQVKADYNQTKLAQPFESLNPLKSESISVLSANATFLNNYQMRFRLRGSLQENNETTSKIGCPFNPNMDHEFSFGPLADKSVRLLYIEQGNGRLAYKLFNDSLDLPPPGKARIRLIYEAFGSPVVAEKRHIFLARKPNLVNSQLNGTSQLQFNFIHRDGQVLLGDYIDLDVSSSGERFYLKSSDGLINGSEEHGLSLETGTRNLVIVHQKDASNVYIEHEVLQDNKYRISILYQLAPYFLISISEVMFSITGLEFSYSMAPNHMKSLILGAWSLTTAFGNMLTVAVESMHLFTSLAHDFLFYAAVMALDMIVFAIIGYYYKPHRPSQT